MDVETLAGIPPWEWPAVAEDVIRDALASDSAPPADRLVAAELAGSIVVMGDPVAEALLSVVRSPDAPAEVRETAAISLGPVLEEIDLGFPDDPEEERLSPAVATAVRKGLRDVYMDPGIPNGVRRSALEASVRCPESWHPAAVRAAFHSGDRDWRRTAVFCMGFVAGFDDEIVQVLEGDDEELRFEAVRAAGGRGVDRAWPTIRAVLGDRRADRNLLLAAIEAVPGIRPAEAGDVLDELSDCGDREVEEAVADALALSGVDFGYLDDF